MINEHHLIIKTTILLLVLGFAVFGCDKEKTGKDKSELAPQIVSSEQEKSSAMQQTISGTTSRYR